MWKTLGEIKIPDTLQFVTEASKDGQAVHIGTDSLQTGRFTQFVTVVVIQGKLPRNTSERSVLRPAS